MFDLNDRQTQILKSVIEEYIETAGPVGSETLDKKYNLGVSPATIRNEMVNLTKMGLLKQSHVSSGRTPTPIALKYYINQLMEEKELGVTEEVAVKERVWDNRNQVDILLQEITRSLAEKTGVLAITTTNQGKIYHSGYANILDIPEFYDIDVTKTVLTIIEDFKRMDEFFSQDDSEEIVHALMGDDFGLELLEPCSLVFTNFNLKDKIKGSLGVIGPCRLNYSHIIPTLKYFGSLLNEISQSI
ncbi:hypothetical protein COT75_02290 [Candidatus Beckwithbacteria bacterium CG10_big_fil_rev_8_21_14_0_10_34_10]|uniref:Heat-inducible transcription repressor HrcA n=1 Tax=Candidatus Beckwithbacteria bacterium CG10_big_fil_rev_8_21_14_0_10_34_10 TaxID=1974495 RepID=A0A2H0W9I3_9BACT|nr:MAG: hypothetical protein COT75_02290 [Candidatus Beckwithbacteria bacterium CG10_big_fil_rev_8_21_14_0_10_34_10]